MNDFDTLFPLRSGRTHDVNGPGARFFAAALMGACGGHCLWVRASFLPGTLNPVALSRFADPEKLLLARTKDQTETLAAAEEGLRSGALALVVLELDRPLDLTPGRRLQLAAEAGHATGLCLFPEGMGNPAAETRWLCRPLFSPSDSTLQLWSIIKNKTGTNRSWTVRFNEETHRIHMVSETAERSGPQETPDRRGLRGHAS
ncbi:hypothetical protein FJU08_04145 [Martelella alba]|uniref:Protein ImuA n=1 Tax=Martelella alba TaxID=2590451 RepID=A0A506UE23_9HYPH|nr:hypothetical protein [Martelella alba]TPW32210.1 hypothetical protein FJU08_04145 [Martelella alba]